MYILFLIFSSATLYAEQTAELGEIVVGDEQIQESPEAPSSFATVIVPKEENIAFESISELIGSTVGTTARSMSGLGQFSTVSIRGSSPEQVSVFLDGVKLNTASGGAFDFSTVPIDSIERIEIIRGGGTAQFGSDAIGGVINIISKKAEKRRIAEAFGGFGSFTTFKLGGSYRKQFKKNGLTLAWTHMQSNGDFTFKTTGINLAGSTSPIGGGRTYTRIHNGFVSEAFLVNWTHRFNETVKLGVLNDFFFTDRDVPGTEEETTLLYPTNPLNAHERIFRNTNSITVDINPFFLKPLSFQWGVTNNLDVDIFRDPTPAIGNPINETTYNYSFGTFLKWQAVFDHRFMNQFITLRYDYRHDYLTDSSPIPTAVLTGTKRRNTNSIFIQDELAFLNDKIVVLPAFRFEKATGFSKDISYKGGIKISPARWFTLKANFERSYRYPGFNELYFPDQGYIRGNPNLNKEKAWNLDAGASMQTRYGSIEAAYFRNWIDNSILFVPISATTIMPTNTFKVDVEGVELGVSLDPIKYLRAGFNYTYMSAHYKSNNNQLPGRPRHEINGRLEFNYDHSKNLGGTIFGNYNYKGSVPINQANTVFLAPRSKMDIGLNLRFKKYYYFTFEAKNITNVQIYDARGFPLPRRSYFATLGAKWS